ncbi:hypothetical protein GA0115240_11481, partial [Streptomyces sp. DvalAA-14]
MLRKRRARSAPAAVDTGRWDVWCARVAGGGRRADAVELLAALRQVTDSGQPHDRAAALDALGRAPAALLVLLDRYARTGAPPAP